jgi:hypothetical protein
MARSLGRILHCGFSGLLICTATAFAVEDPLARRPAFSEAEQPARVPAQCGELRAQSDGLATTDTRIDLALVGALTSVNTDGALWYLVACAAPDIRVMCVTYESNGMKAGDQVLLRGGYTRVDPDHVVLDPCLASPASDAAPDR